MGKLINLKFRKIMGGGGSKEKVVSSKVREKT